VNDFVEIYMPLLGEGVDVWRPIRAEHMGGNVYRVPPKSAGHEDETWAFSPGEDVICETIELSEGPALAATRRANRPE
jgi:hypothetical protein